MRVTVKKTRGRTGRLVRKLAQMGAISMPKWMWVAMGFPEEAWHPEPAVKITRKELEKMMREVGLKEKPPRWLERMLGLPDSWT